MRLYVLMLSVGLCFGQLVNQAATLAQFRTPLGDVEVELFDKEKPATVANFIQYVESGTYKDMFFHRWEPNFVIQGGGFRTANRSQASAAIENVPVGPAVTNEYSVGRIFSNIYGTIAMARVGGQTNSATSQWFFNLTNNSFLDAVDGGFTVFGRVVRGTNVLERFNATSAANAIYLANAGNALNHLPVLSATPTLADLVYLDITLLNVHVETVQTGRQISWQSVSNKVNQVEFTTQLPPVWQALVSTNGTGQPIQIVDTQAANAWRFYRVRVDY